MNIAKIKKLSMTHLPPLKKFTAYKKILLYNFILHIIAVSAVIRADYYYIDDLGRAAQGYRGWDNFSRHLSNMLAPFVHGGSYLTDISPLPQLLALFVISLSGTILLYLFSDGKKIAPWKIIAVLPLGLSPYFLECLSYKYDSPYMAISVLASILPFLFMECGMVPYAIASVAGILAMCMTYQAASGIYPMIVIFLVYKQWNRKSSLQETIRFLSVSCASYAVAILFFQTFIMHKVDDYVSSSVFPLSQLLPGYCKNVYSYCGTLYLDFKKEWLLLIIFMMTAFLFLSVRDSLQKKGSAFIVSLFALGAAGLSSYGLYPALQAPLFSPRAMYGVGAFLALIMITIVNAEKIYPAKIVCACLCWCFFVFAFTYGNALAAQKNYTDFRIQLVIEDLNELEIMNTEEIKKIQLIGNIGKAPVIRNMPQNYQMLNRLIPDTFGGGWMWREAYFYNYFDLRNIEQIAEWTNGWDPSSEAMNQELPVVKDTMYHRISSDGTYVLIELKS